MSSEDRKRLETERTEINARIAAASAVEKPILQAQYAERLSHLAARLEPSDPPAEPPPPKK